MSTPYGCLRGSSRTARHTCSRMRGGGRTLPCSTKGSYSGHSAACRACKAPTDDTRHELGLSPVPPRLFGRRHAVRVYSRPRPHHTQYTHQATGAAWALSKAYVVNWIKILIPLHGTGPLDRLALPRWCACVCVCGGGHNINTVRIEVHAAEAVSSPTYHLTGRRRR